MTRLLQQVRSLIGRAAVPLPVLVAFTRQLAIMINTGVPLHNALHFLSRSQSGRMRQVTEDICIRIQQGMYLSEAMARYPGIFSPTFTGTIRAGESSGLMALVLGRLAEHLELTLRLRRRIVSALAYPAVLALACLTVTVLLVVVIMPLMVPVLRDLGVPLPWPTRILVGLTDLLTNPFFWLAFLGFVLLLVSGGVYLSTRNDLMHALRFRVDSFLMGLPVVGRLLACTSAARILHLMALMLSVGIPAEQVLHEVSRSASNSVLSQALSRACDDLVEGCTLSEALQRRHAFDRGAMQMIYVSEEVGQLEMMLNRLTRVYDEEVELTVTVLSQALEPIMLVAMSGVVGFVTMAVFLPWIKMLGEIL